MRTGKLAKISLYVFVLVLLSKLIGTLSFNIGFGEIQILPLVYVCLVGMLLGPRFLKLVSAEEIKQTKSMIIIGILFLAAYQGTRVGPQIGLLIATGPALILQEFGNLGTLLLAFPIAIALGMGRQSIGITFSKAKESDMAAIMQYHGLDSEEGKGFMGVYIVNNVIGMIVMSSLVSIAALLPLHPYALAMATGIGSTSLMTVGTGTLAGIFPAYSDQIVALGTSSNLLTTATGIYMDLFIALPLANYLYNKFFAGKSSKKVAKGASESAK